METYTVSVSRTESNTREFKVAADSRKAASAAALRMAADTEFPRGDSPVYSVEGVTGGSETSEPLSLKVYTRKGKGLSPESIEDITCIPADGFELVDDPSKLEADVVAAVFSTKVEAEAFHAGIVFIDPNDDNTYAIDTLTPDGETPMYIVLVHFGDSDQEGLRIEDKRGS